MSRKPRAHSVSKILANKNAEIIIYAKIKTDVIIKNNRKDIFVHDMKRKEITLIEIFITNLDILTQIQNEKKRKYDLLTKEITLKYICKINIIPYICHSFGKISCNLSQ